MLELTVLYSWLDELNCSAGKPVYACTCTDLNSAPHIHTGSLPATPLITVLSFVLPMPVLFIIYLES